MGATTPEIGLYKFGGGSSGLIQPDETVDVDRINDNSDLIDNAVKGVRDRSTALETKTKASVARYYGTKAEREAFTPPVRGIEWVDTDNGKLTFLSSSDGKWRQMEGSLSIPAGAWNVTATSGAVSYALRTVDTTLPTQIESDESILIATDNPGTGFGLIGLVTAINDVTNNRVNLQLRQFQFHSSNQQNMRATWRITSGRV